MNTVDKIKLTSLKREIAAGIEDLVHGRFQTYNVANLMELVDDVKRRGRIHLRLTTQRLRKKM
jgi:hypothetical protein